MSRLNGFISYGGADKNYALRLKSLLNDYCGIITNIAPDDVIGGTISVDEIFNYITNCDIFIPLISRRLKKSSFANQEIGVAYALGKKFIPVKLASVDPFGLIYKYQGIPLLSRTPTRYHVDSDNLWEISVTIGNICLTYKSSTSIYQKSHESIIYAFCNSSSFDCSNMIIKKLLTLHDLSENDLNLIRGAIQSNPQIDRGEFCAFELPNLKEFLKNRYGMHIA
jgi:hypothetical protein